MDCANDGRRMSEDAVCDFRFHFKYSEDFIEGEKQATFIFVEVCFVVDWHKMGIGQECEILQINKTETQKYQKQKHQCNEYRSWMTHEPNKKK